MKTNIILSAICLMMSFTAYSQQDEKASVFSIIPQTGFNLSRLTSDAADGVRIGYQFGVSTRIGRRLYAQPGFYWMRQNPRFIGGDPIGGGNDITEEFTISGFQIKGLAGYKVVDTRIFKLRAQAGPAFSWVSGVKDNRFELEKEDFKSSIWGAEVGGGIDLFFLTLDVNYEFGISKVFNSISDARNNVLFITLGARLDF
ncbi:porin family protein [Rhodocytophaga aerolata]|uniref:Porin family protein n=1 Tax=Rhodocytophaga aerolata TaxID=455078 RepID=A0ABT8RDX2_9BACT|nr:porin family protein [Rhodocytophaga aerolata]MDO1449398.1 porin family protein [Rhodocytophaga aerolata]